MKPIILCCSAAGGRGIAQRFSFVPLTLACPTVTHVPPQPDDRGENLHWRPPSAAMRVSPDGPGIHIRGCAPLTTQRACVACIPTVLVELARLDLSRFSATLH